jgi:hypothetical protein
MSGSQSQPAGNPAGNPAAQAGSPAAQAETSFTWIPNVKGFIGGTIINTVAEMYSLMPDSVLFGSLLLYFLTQNLSYGVFAAFIIELTLSHRLIAWVFSQAVGSPDVGKTISCRAGYKTPRLDVKRMIDHDPYPSYGIFSIASMATYLGFATSEYSDVLAALGENWKTRSMVAYIFMALIVSTFIMARIFLSDCNDTLGEIITAVFLAIIVGYIFFYINKTIFGQESINFLGLPNLATKDKDANGNQTDIFICAAV